MGRRKFLKLAGTGLGALALAGLPRVLANRPSPSLPDKPRPPEIVNREPSKTLRIAQWYDYWPGIFLENFRGYVKDKYGVSIDITQEFYTSNEELLYWITQGHRLYDVIFPTNFMVDTMRSLGLLAPLSMDLIPNYSNLFSGWTKFPWDHDAQGNVYSVPYQWGTTGIGFNTDFIRREDIEAAGWDAFLWDSYQLKTPGPDGNSVVNFNNNRKMSLLHDCREVLGLGMKLQGWHRQKDVDSLYPRTGVPWASPVTQDPNAITDPVWPATIGSSPPSYSPDPISDLSAYKAKGYQWLLNETADYKLAVVKDAILAIKPRLFAFETAQQAPYLARRVTYIAQGWSGDFIYLARPYMEVGYGRNPIDYVIPRQGSTLWVDSGCVPANAPNPFWGHELINFFLDCKQGALITDWSLDGTPNECSYPLLLTYKYLTVPYDPRQDTRIYPDDTTMKRLEFMRGVGYADLQKYLSLCQDIMA